MLIFFQPCSSDWFTWCRRECFVQAVTTVPSYLCLSLLLSFSTATGFSSLLTLADFLRPDCNTNILANNMQNSRQALNIHGKFKNKQKTTVSLQWGWRLNDGLCIYAKKWKWKKVFPFCCSYSMTWPLYQKTQDPQLTRAISKKALSSALAFWTIYTSCTTQA